jgi:hypothetical protein
MGTYPILSPLKDRFPIYVGSEFRCAASPKNKVKNMKELAF